MDRKEDKAGKISAVSGNTGSKAANGKVMDEDYQNGSDRYQSEPSRSSSSPSKPQPANSAPKKTPQPSAPQPQDRVAQAASKIVSRIKTKQQDDASVDQAVADMATSVGQPASKTKELSALVKAELKGMGKLKQTNPNTSGTNQFTEAEGNPDMRLMEIFDDIGRSEDLVQHLRDDVIDILTPLAAHGVPFVTIQNVMDKLATQRSGVAIDRALIMAVLDPDEVKMVTKIEGDRVYFRLPPQNSRKVDDQQEKKDAKHVKNAAAKQAQKNVRQK